ncbi:tyrosine-protein phosphatase [Actinoallomurus acanthiterrae]
MLRDGAAVVIHCSAGIHRTGMLTYALLRATRSTSGEARLTLARLRARTADEVGDERLTWPEHLCATMSRP